MVALALDVDEDGLDEFFFHTSGGFAAYNCDLSSPTVARTYSADFSATFMDVSRGDPRAYAIEVCVEIGITVVAPDMDGFATQTGVAVADATDGAGDAGHTRSPSSRHDVDTLVSAATGARPTE